jgi:hypothetical protein
MRNRYPITPMENTAAKIRVSLREGLLEIEGSEDFVSKQIENLKEVITKLPSSHIPLVHPHATPPSPATGNGQPPADLTAKPTEDAAKYENVISVAGGVVKVLKDIPGDSKAEKSANAALLYLFGKNLLTQEQATFSEIRQVCKEHACLDGANFAGSIKDQKEWFIVTGGRKSEVAQLTKPGKKQAQSVVDSLNVE